jgi:methionyl-tRNA formyltransferase
MTRRAVVFGYHNVGVRCLKVLLAHGVDVRLVVTHEDNPNETIWFDSLASVARDYGIPCITPADANTPEMFERLESLAPDFLFSFYYRQMLKAPLLATVRQGGYNMHGSLLPRYRGRVPVNWAVLHGETETGATLHRMVEKPDAGEVVGRQSVPILPDDTARDVFGKVTVAAEMLLNRVLPDLLDGTAPHLPLDLTQGSYFGGRKPEDGRIDWGQPAQARSTTWCAPLPRPIRAPSATSPATTCASCAPCSSRSAPRSPPARPCTWKAATCWPGAVMAGLLESLP